MSRFVNEGPHLHEDERRRFEQACLPHLTAAYNLARWLMHDAHEAEDILQEAYLRALKSFGGFHGTDGRAWLLTIIRNSCYSRLRGLRKRQAVLSFDENLHGTAPEATMPVTLLGQKEEQQFVQQALEELPLEFREVVILRELEGLAYKEIAAVIGISMGTVMSRLARGRALLRRQLAGRLAEEP